MKRIIATGAVAALAMVGFAGAASAEPMGKAYGKQIKDTTDSSYGQLLNVVRDPANHLGQDVFPSASGAKAFVDSHSFLFED